MKDLSGKITEIPTKLTGSFIRHFLKDRYKKTLKKMRRGKAELPEGTARARVVIFHGYSKHSDTPDMQKFRHALQHKGKCDVFFCDLPYHGLSVPEGKEHLRGKIKFFSRLVEAVYGMTLEVLARPYIRPIPFVLVGHSTGALAIVKFLIENPALQKYPLRVHLIASPFRLDHNAHELVQKYKQVIEKTARWISYLPYVSDIPVGDIGVGDLSDKLEYNEKIGLRSVMELHVATIEVKRGLQKISVPITFHHGERDRTALIKDARDAFDLIMTPLGKKQFIAYPDAEHGLLDEGSRGKVLENILMCLDEDLRRSEWEPVEYENVADDAIEISAEVYFFGCRLLIKLKSMLLRWWRKLQFWKK